MDWSNNRRGCAVLILLVLLLLGVILYFGWDSFVSNAPSPNEGFFPPAPPTKS